MHIYWLRATTMSLILFLSNFAWADRNKDIKVTIEEPAVGQSYSGIANLRGWAVAPEGLNIFLDVYIDGITTSSEGTGQCACLTVARGSELLRKAMRMEFECEMSKEKA